MVMVSDAITCLLPKVLHAWVPMDGLMHRYSWAEVDGASLECLCLPSLLVEGTEDLLELSLSFELRDLMDPPVPEEKSFYSVVPS